jgi:hypothetical protein
MCSYLWQNARNTGRFAFSQHIWQNYALHTLCGAPHNVCNEEGKLEGLPLNRAIYGEDGEMVDIIAGTFLVVGLNEDDFAALPDELAVKFGKLFESPEMFYSVNGQICAKKVEPVIKLTPEEAWRQDFCAVQACAQDMGNGSASRAVNDNKLNAFIREMTRKHGEDNCKLVLAATVNSAPDDDRYSPSVKKWAADIAPFPQSPDHEGEPCRFDKLCIREQPGIVNDIVQTFMRREKELSYAAREAER